MASYNRVVLVGNLTREVELKYTQGGHAVTDVGLAVNDRRKSQTGEWIEETTFIDITLWGRQAEVAAEYLSKGSSILIEGRLKLDTWETDGQKRSKLRVVGERMQMLSSRSPGARPQQQSNNEYSESVPSPNTNPGASTTNNAPPSGTPEDDIPF